MLAYAIGYARDGHPITARVTETIGAVGELFTEHWPTSADRWLIDGRPPQPGDLVTNPAYAAVLEGLVAAGGPSDAAVDTSRGGAAPVTDGATGTPATGAPATGTPAPAAARLASRPPAPSGPRGSWRAPSTSSCGRRTGTRRAPTTPGSSAPPTSPRSGPGSSPPPRSGSAVTPSPRPAPGVRAWPYCRCSLCSTRCPTSCSTRPPPTARTRSSRRRSSPWPTARPTTATTTSRSTRCCRPGTPTRAAR